MNREIKFRVFDKDKKRMSKPLPIYTPIVQWSDGDIDMPTQFGLAKVDRFIFLQYTGLKDKNGKEIYEGDILKDCLTNMVYVVKFGRCWKYAFNGWYCENEEMKYVTTINGDYDTNINSNIEIIGNIYEHPELIK